MDFTFPHSSVVQITTYHKKNHEKLKKDHSISSGAIRSGGLILKARGSLQSRRVETFPGLLLILT